MSSGYRQSYVHKYTNTQIHKYLNNQFVNIIYYYYYYHYYIISGRLSAVVHKSKSKHLLKYKNTKNSLPYYHLAGCPRSCSRRLERHSRQEFQETPPRGHPANKHIFFKMSVLSFLKAAFKVFNKFRKVLSCECKWDFFIIQTCVYNLKVMYDREICQHQYLLCFRVLKVIKYS